MFETENDDPSDVVIYSTQDGSCLNCVVPTSCDPGDNGVPLVMPPSLWSWKALFSLKLGGVCALFLSCSIANVSSRSSIKCPVILATAVVEFTSTTVQAIESSAGDNGEQTRLVAYELRKPQANTSTALEIVQIGAWVLDGFPESLECHVSPHGR